MKEDTASAMRHQRLQALFLAVVSVYSVYALALALAPIGLYTKGVGVFFAGAPVGMLLYHVWGKMRGLEEAAQL